MTVGQERKYTGILHDLSARVHIEERLREQASLARLGEMAAVIAHEVKNPLAGVRGAIQVIGSRLPEASTDATIVNDIIARIDALDQLMKDLLLFARPPHLRRARVDLVSLLTSTSDLARSDPALGTVSVEIDGTAPPVNADPEMLRIVFHNLILNAAHAMRGEGRIRVAVTSRGSVCQLAFTDSGPGIPADILEQDLRALLHHQARAAPAWGYRPPSGSSKPTTGRSASSARPPEARRSPSGCLSSCQLGPT